MLGFWVAGYAGLLVTAVVSLAVLVTRGRIGRLVCSGWTAAGAFMAAAASLSLSTWLQYHGHSGRASDLLGDTVPHLLALAAVARLALGLAAPFEEPAGQDPAPQLVGPAQPPPPRGPPRVRGLGRVNVADR